MAVSKKNCIKTESTTSTMVSGSVHTIFKFRFAVVHEKRLKERLSGFSLAQSILSTKYQEAL